jgi:hypothetical protein
MKTISLIFLCLGLFLITGMFQGPGLLAQDFPYSVPQAPEFDRRGNHIESAPADSYEPRRRSRRHSRHHSPGNETDLRSVRPYAPNGPQPMVAPPQPYPAVPPAGYASRPAPAPSQHHTQTPPSPPAQQSPAAYQGRPDCSRYPMMIAQARSEAEMRGVAQMYLTCLLKSGWNMDQAKRHVIMTIESTYRSAR